MIGIGSGAIRRSWLKAIRRRVQQDARERVRQSLLAAVFLLNKVVDLVRWGTHHEQRVRIQRLAHAMLSTSCMPIGKAVQQVCVALGSFAATMTVQLIQDLRNFSRHLLGLTSCPSEHVWRKRRR